MKKKVFILHIILYLISAKCFTQNTQCSGTPNLPKTQAASAYGSPGNFASPICNPDNGDQHDGIYIPGFGFIIIGRGSWDPNLIKSPIGYDSARWVSINDKMGFTIYFENDPDLATAPVHNAYIYYKFKPGQDPTTFRLGSYGFNGMVFTVPANLNSYQTRVDLRDSLGVYVYVTAGIDVTSNTAFWIFQSIDPLTNLPPADPLTGFLPIKDTSAAAADLGSSKGEGFASFTVKPMSTAQTRDTIFAQARIVFDVNDTIPTNTEFNTIDAVPPASSVNNLPSSTLYAFTISWAGADDPLGSGIRSYDLYISKNGGAFTRELTNTDSTSYYFVGEPGSTYNFYTRATDNTGNIEPDKPGGDKTITIITPANNICPGADTYFVMPRPGNDYNYQWQVDSTGEGFVNLAANAVHLNVNTDTMRLNLPPTYYYGYKYRCIATKDGSPVLGTVYILKFLSSWQGNTNNAWENPANWNCGIIPDQYTDVIVPEGITNNPVVNNNTSCRSLLVSSGVTLTINNGVKLDVKGK